MCVCLGIGIRLRMHLLPNFLPTFDLDKGLRGGGTCDLNMCKRLMKKLGRLQN